MTKIVVCGAGGYVGRRLVQRLVKAGGAEVHAISRKPHVIPGAAIHALDLLEFNSDLHWVVEDCDFVYNLAASVGGIGFVKTSNADCLVNATINLNLLRACAAAGVR